MATRCEIRCVTIEANASCSVHAGIQHSTFRDAIPPGLIMCWDHLMMLCEYISVGVYVQTEHINEHCRLSRGNVPGRRMNHDWLIQLNAKKKGITLGMLLYLWMQDQISLACHWGNPESFKKKIKPESIHTLLCSPLKSTTDDRSTPPTTCSLHFPFLSFLLSPQ